MNKISASCVLFAASLFAQAGIAAEQGLPSWFDPTASLPANAEHASRDNVDPALATRTLIQTGSQVTDSVKEVVRAYQTCRALYAAVGEGVKTAPRQTGSIASAVVSLEQCACGAEELWARSRMEGRIRAEHRSPGIALSVPCSCAAATAEAVTSAVPNQADAVFSALSNYSGDCQCNASAFAGTVNGLGDKSRDWIDEQRKKAENSKAGDGPGIVDVLGRVAPRREDDWRPTTGALRVVRKSDDCYADVEKDDKFQLGKVWDPGVAAQPLKCSKEPRSVLLREYIEEPGAYQLVQIDNAMQRPVDLGATRHVIEIYVGDKREPERIIPLTGLIQAQHTFIVASTTAPADVRANADMVVPELNAVGAQAVVLRRLGDEVSLACPADTMALVQQYPVGPIPPIPLDPQISQGEPRTDESPVDPNRGGEIASPN